MLLFCSRICLIRSIDDHETPYAYHAAVLELRGTEKLCAPLKLLSLIIYAFYTKNSKMSIKTLSNIVINTGATKVQQFALFFAQNLSESRFKLVSDLIKGCF